MNALLESLQGAHDNKSGKLVVFIFRNNEV